MIFHDIEQNTDDWYDLRAGKLTGSSFGKIMANFGKGFGDPAKKLAVNIAAERIKGGPLQGDNYSNSNMERGHEQEPIARMLYEEETFNTVSNGGFFEHEHVGCSPDGLVKNDGVLEIKSVIATTHFATIKRQSYDPAYKWQLIGNLYYTKRQFIDFVSFCADFPADKKLFICTLDQAKLSAEFEMLETRVEQFLKLVDESTDIILNSDYMVKL